MRDREGRGVSDGGGGWCECMTAATAGQRKGRLTAPRPPDVTVSPGGCMLPCRSIMLPAKVRRRQS